MTAPAPPPPSPPPRPAHTHTCLPPGPAGPPTSAPAPSHLLHRAAHVSLMCRFVPLSTVTELAQLIRRDRVDVLVELTGHTAHNRLGAVARRPAPIQARSAAAAAGGGAPSSRLHYPCFFVVFGMGGGALRANDTHRQAKAGTAPIKMSLSKAQLVRCPGGHRSVPPPPVSCSPSPSSLRNIAVAVQRCFPSFVCHPTSFYSPSYLLLHISSFVPPPSHLLLRVSSFTSPSFVSPPPGAGHLDRVSQLHRPALGGLPPHGCRVRPARHRADLHRCAPPACVCALGCGGVGPGGTERRGSRGVGGGLRWGGRLISSAFLNVRLLLLRAWASGECRVRSSHPCRAHARMCCPATMVAPPARPPPPPLRRRGAGAASRLLPVLHARPRRPRRRPPARPRQRLRHLWLLQRTGKANAGGGRNGREAGAMSILCSATAGFKVGGGAGVAHGEVRSLPDAALPSLRSRLPCLAPDNHVSPSAALVVALFDLPAGFVAALAGAARLVPHPAGCTGQPAGAEEQAFCLRGASSLCTLPCQAAGMERCRMAAWGVENGGWKGRGQPL
jgi:hypothetical protein